MSILFQLCWNRILVFVIIGLDPIIQKADNNTTMKDYYIYILASERNGTLYIGVTNDLIRRVSEHRQELIPGFTKTYHIHNLVYYEQGHDISAVILREKQLKKWNRKWKLDLIEKSNPDWKDLWDEIT